MGPGYFGRTRIFFRLFCGVMKFFTSFWWGHEIFPTFSPKKKNIFIQILFWLFFYLSSQWNNQENKVGPIFRWFPRFMCPWFPRYEVTMCDVNVQTFCTLFAMRPCSELLLELNLTFQVIFYEFSEHIRHFTVKAIKWLSTDF